MNDIFLPLFLLLLLMDVAFVALRSSLMNARLPYLITLREQKPQEVEPTIQLLESQRLRPMLRMCMAMLHFLLAGAVYFLWATLFPHLATLLPSLLVLFLAMLLIVALEFFIEGRISTVAEPWALRLTWLGRLLNFIFMPVSTLLVLALGKQPTNQAHLIPVSEDELKNWVEEDQPESTLEKGERQMIYSIFQFSETLCREIMIPRIDVLALEASTPIQEAITAITHSGHSRVPVYEDSIDNVVGMLYAKDMLRARLDGEKPATLRGMLRPPYFVPEAKKVDELLSEMQAKGVHIAVVVDEYGGMAGLVTLEDIVEEIVGEIRDEYDQSEEMPYQQITPDEYVFLGRIDLEDFNDILDTHLPRDVADTLGGYISAQVGHIPAGGEHLQVGDWLLTVETVTGRRVRKVHVRRQQASEEVEENDSAVER